MNKPIYLSIVIPAYKSKNSLKNLYKRICATFVKENIEIILVDDFSQDGTWEVIENLSRKDFRVRGIKLSRNYGQHPATICGITHSKGQWVATIDDDLEQSPEDLKKLLSKALEGYDLVYGNCKNRTHPYWRILASRLLKSILRKTIVSFNGWSSIRIIRGRLARKISVFSTSTPIVDGYLAWIIKNYAVVDVEHNKRYAGKSNYNLRKLLRLGLNFFLEFSNSPLRIIGILGIFMSLIGLLIMIYIIYAKIVGLIVAVGYASLMSAILFVAGFQFLIMSVIGEYIAFINSKVSNKPIFAISIDTKNDQFS